MNGSLFTKIAIERNSYRINPETLKKVIQFLDSFSFGDKDQESGVKNGLDPEILGYILEKSMSAEERGDKGAYYTPSDLTNYLTKKTISKYLLTSINSFLVEKLHYKEIDLLDSLQELGILNEKTSRMIFEHIKKMRICDNTCGSGAFLLSSAQFLLEIFSLINERAGLNYSQVALRKMIITNNLFGVDINNSAVEVAKLRLWLWLVSVYEKDSVEPLPNIEYNLRVGNTLIGYTTIEMHYEKKAGLLKWDNSNDEDSIYSLLSKRKQKIEQYKKSSGLNTISLKNEIDDLHKQISEILDISFYHDLHAASKKKEKEKINKEIFLKLKAFHWGYEFFNQIEGFDVIIGNPPYGIEALPSYEEKIMEEVAKEISKGKSMEEVEEVILKEKSEKKGVIKDILESMGYYTYSSTEYASYFVERSIRLLKPGGMIGLVITNGIAANKNMIKVRDFVSEHIDMMHIAFFGIRPARLFTDAEVNVGILWGNKKANSNEKEGKSQLATIYTTEFIKFTKKQRISLFDNLNFEDATALSLGTKGIGVGKDMFFAKIGFAVIREVLYILKEHSNTILRRTTKKSKFSLEYRASGRYWLNALEKIPYKSTKVRQVHFLTEIERDFAILIINSSLFYVFWCTYGNLRDLNINLIQTFPLPSSKVMEREKDTIKRLKKKITDASISTFQPDKNIFEMKYCRAEIDLIDDFLGKCYEFNEEQVEFVKKYDSHVRVAV